ncbi:MAG TPA: ABC transporter permease, partial [Vicinamibacterales bacterium]|nr:ABC transporter permease [Vicinamibacterales bacterium]
MRWWRRRISARDSIQDDVRDEFAAHVELRIKDNLRRGMTPAEAGREAATRFGPVREVAVNCEKIQRRRESTVRSLWLDLRGAWMGWRRTPLTAVLAAIVGSIGIATALVAALLADAAFLRQPAGMQADDRVFTVLKTANNGKNPQNISYQLAQQLAAVAPEHQFFVWTAEEFQLSANTRSALWPGAYVGGAYFDALGVTAAAGRLLDRDDELARHEVVVISGKVARELFGSTAAAVGQPLRVNGRVMAIVGVAAGFRGGISTERADIWLPITVESLLAIAQTFPDGSRVQSLAERADIGWIMGGVRLASLGDLPRTRSRYTAVIRSVPRIGAAAEGEDHRAALLFDRPWKTPFSYDRDQLAVILKPIGIAVGLTLVLAAACMSSLLVGRLVQRRHELAIRQALGASRWRLLRLVIVEHAMAMAAAAALASIVVAVALAALGRLQIAGSLRVSSLAVALDSRAVLIGGALTVVLGAVSLFGPLAFVRANTRTTSVSGARVVSSSIRLRRVLMTTQVTTGCALLAAGGLLTRTIDQMLAQPRGFDPSQVAFVEVDLGKAGLDEGARARVVEQLRQRMHSGNGSIALTTGRPYAGNEYDWIHVNVPDKAEAAGRQLVFVSRIDGPYFGELGIRVVAGRIFTANSAARREAIVSEKFAQHYWPGQSAIGRVIEVGSGKGEPREVVGVVAGLLDMGLRGGPTSRLYLPLDGDVERLLILARRPQPAIAADAELAPLVAAIDERLSPKRKGVLEDLARQLIEQRLMIRGMTLVVGAGSLLMIAVGVWGLAHSSVSQRWREFGLRLALGAERRDVARLALRDAVIVAGAGAGLGAVAAWQFGRALGSLLVGVAPSDPLVIATSALVVAAAVFAGAWLPARRAS